MNLRKLRLKHNWPRAGGVRRKHVWAPLTLTYTESVSPTFTRLMTEWAGQFKEQPGPVKPRFIHPPGRLSKAAIRLMGAEAREERRAERRAERRSK